MEGGRAEMVSLWRRMWRNSAPGGVSIWRWRTYGMAPGTDEA